VKIYPSETESMHTAKEYRFFLTASYISKILPNTIGYLKFYSEKKWTLEIFLCD